MGSDNNMVAVPGQPGFINVPRGAFERVRDGGRDPRDLVALFEASVKRVEELEATLARLAQPDAQQGASSPASGERVIEAVAKAIEGPHLPVPVGSKWTLDELREVRWKRLTAQEQEYRKHEARAAIAAYTPLAAATQPAVPQEGRRWVSSGPRTTDDPHDRNLWWVGPGRPVAWVTRDAARAIITALTGAGENGEQGA